MREVAGDFLFNKGQIRLNLSSRAIVVGSQFDCFTLLCLLRQLDVSTPLYEGVDRLCFMIRSGNLRQHCFICREYAKYMAGRKRQVGVTLSDDQIAKLVMKAEAEGMSQSGFVRRIILLYLRGDLMTSEEHKRLLNDEMLKYEKQHGGVY